MNDDGPQTSSRVATVVRRIFLAAAVFWSAYLILSVVIGDRLGLVIAGLGLGLTLIQLWLGRRAT